VVIVREDRTAGGKVELFCVERHVRSGFLGGAVVFPGGKLDEADLRDEWVPASTPLDERALALGAEASLARGLAVAALREALEEAAILPLAPRDPDARELLDLRRSVSGASGTRTLLDALAGLGSRLDTGRLAALGRWITPEPEPRRYDTRFYLLALPSGQEGAHDDHETTASFWAPARATLDRWAKGEVFLAPPTAFVLELFADAETLEEAFDIARHQSLAPVEPCFVQEPEGGDTVLTLPGDPLHPTQGLPPIRPGGPTRFVLEAGRLVPKTAG